MASRELKEVTCPRCEGKRMHPVYRGVKDLLLCDECRPKALLDTKRRYRESHREELRAYGRAYIKRRYAEDEAFAEQARDRIRTLTREQPGYLSEIRRRSYRKHAEARRARRREHQIRHRQRIYDRDGGICHICAEKVPFAEFEVDHIVPVSRGGSSDDANLATTHRDCNRRKATRLVEELMA